PYLDVGLSGFYSKDALINAAWAATPGNGSAAFAFVAGVIAAGLTSFYSWRLVFMTFHGHAKWDAHADHGEADHGHGVEPHESPWVMLVPLLVLAFGATFAGAMFVERFIGPERLAFWKNALFTAPTNHVLDAHAMPAWVAFAPLTVTAIGFAVAWWAYVRNEGMGARLAKGPVWAFLYHKWYFDEIYHFIFVRGAEVLGDLFWKGGDKRLIDGLGPDGVSQVSYAIGRATGRLQTGYVYHYAFVMLLGVAGLLSFALWAFAK
ncbi:MAG: NADH-quinone oxidoreductase subunit L, partial [Caulobacteraceae bacterium]